MKIRFAVMIGVVAVTLGAAPEDDRPILHESPQRLVELIDATVRDVGAAAAVNVVRDSVRKRIRIFASSLAAKRGLTTVGDFEVETVFDFAFLPSEKAAPLPYHSTHNKMVLSFACAQITAGKQEFGVELVRSVAKAQPTLRVGAGATELSVGQLLTSLEQGSGQAKELLKDLNHNWEYHVKEHAGEH